MRILKHLDSHNPFFFVRSLPSSLAKRFFLLARVGAVRQCLMDQLAWLGPVAGENGEETCGFASDVSIFYGRAKGLLGISVDFSALWPMHGKNVR